MRNIKELIEWCQWGFLIFPEALNENNVLEQVKMIVSLAIFVPVYREIVSKFL